MKKENKNLTIIFLLGVIIFTGYKVEGQNEAIKNRGREQITNYKLENHNKIYKIGDKGPAGGWIFYDKGSYTDGWRYLEAAPIDQGEAEFGCYLAKYWETSILLYDGKKNTKAIIKGCRKKKIAAQLCITYRGGGKKDWFLPSADELELMYNNLHKKGIGNFTNSSYWSSTKLNYGITHIDFNTGEQDCNDNDNIFKVRAVRFL